MVFETFDERFNALKNELVVNDLAITLTNEFLNFKSSKNLVSFILADCLNPSKESINFKKLWVKYFNFNEIKQNVSSKSNHFSCCPDVVPNNDIELEINHNINHLQDSSFGNKIVATIDIEVGELIHSDYPYECILDWDYVDKYCSYCFKYLNSKFFVNCRQNNFCSSRFCSQLCEVSSWNRYHKYECNEYFQYLKSLKLPLHCYLAYRIGILAITHVKLPFNYRSTKSHEEMTTLVSHFKERNVADYFRLASISCCLSHFQYFVKEPIELVQLAAIIFDFLCIIPCNAHTITYTPKPLEYCDLMTNIQTFEIGIGLYFTASLFNHSCDPDVVRVYNGVRVNIKALKNIKSSYQIFDNYGYHFSVHNKNERLHKLKEQYFFVCNCPACSFNYPLYVELLRMFNENLIDTSLWKKHGIIMKSFSSINLPTLSKKSLIGHCHQFLSCTQYIFDKNSIEYMQILCKTCDIQEVLKVLYSIQFFNQ